MLLPSSESKNKKICGTSAAKLYSRVHQLFVDFKKTYDSVRREVLYNILMQFGVSMELSAPVIKHGKFVLSFYSILTNV
jgi:hypothetical protein